MSEQTPNQQKDKSRAVNPNLEMKWWLANRKPQQNIFVGKNEAEVLVGKLQTPNFKRRSWVANAEPQKKIGGSTSKTLEANVLHACQATNCPKPYTRRL